MTKNDLKAGYLIRNRRGELRIIAPANDTLVIISQIGRYGELTETKEDLTSMNGSEFDIMEVYGYSTMYHKVLSFDTNFRPLLWKRKEEETEEKPTPINLKINEFAQLVHENAVNHGWWSEKRTFGEIVALCHSELSEALEEYRSNKPMVYWIDDNDNIETDIKKYNGQKLEGIATEMIDCIIRILDWCGKEQIDVEKVLNMKHEYNKTRPYKHGGKKI